MTHQDRPKFAEALHVLAETFSEPLSDIKIEGYFEALRDCDLGQINLAVRLALRGCTFFPKPVELRTFIFGDVDALADTAWASVLREIARVGYIGTPRFTDPRILPAITDLWGSWQRLCETLPAEGPTLIGWIKQFKSAYRTQDVHAQQAALASGMPRDLRTIIGAITKAKTLPPLRIVEVNDGDDDDR